MPQTVDQIIASRASLYNPQRTLIGQQQAALPGQEAADVAGLDTAKTNAFSDIAVGANNRGMTYSGVPISEQSRYIGEKYLPAVAGVKNTYAANRSKLEAALLGINQDEATTAQKIQSDQSTAEANAAAKAEATQIARERLAITVAKANTPKEPSTADRQLAFNQDLAGAYQYLKTNPGAIKPGAREQVAAALATQHGIPYNQVIDQVRQFFPDNWESQIKRK